jgi:hypothetical protein
MSKQARPAVVTVTADDYTRSHGKTPRGRGCWAFEPTLYSACGQSATADIVFSPCMTYTEAKRWAREQVPAMIASVKVPDSVLISQVIMDAQS